MIIDKQNFAKRNSARDNLRDEGRDIFGLVQSWNDDRDGVGGGGHFVAGADDGIRTRDLRFTKPLLYQLSYVGTSGKDRIRLKWRQE